MSFRKAHEVVGQAVRYCMEHGKTLEDLSQPELVSLSTLIRPDVKGVLSMRSCVERRSSYGGTAPEQVENQIALARTRSKAQTSFCQKERDRLIKCWNELIYAI
jgi:argininosuccinate lyase